MKPELIVMLTHNDRTVENAYEVFEGCVDTPAKYWGFKEVGIPPVEMKKLCHFMKEKGKETFLEVVAYSEEECLAGAKLAVECGFDYLLGTLYFDSVNEYAKKNHIDYFPFVGKLTGRPTVLNGTIEEVIQEGKDLTNKGVSGFDLLGYRYTGDAPKLIQEFVSAMDVPVCLAGSISSYERLDEVKKVKPWTFTIGGAFFENKFDGTFAEQVTKVVDYMKK